MVNYISYGYENPISYKQSLRNCVESYFYLGRHSVVDLISNNTFESPASSWCVTALKIISYVTVVIPVLVALALFCLRCTDPVKSSEKILPFEIARTATKVAKAVIVIGGPGSGKNSLIEACQAKGEYVGYEILDVDQEMEKIPEYQRAVQAKDANAANKFWGQAKDIRDKKFETYLKAKKNLVFIGAGAMLDHYKHQVIGRLKKSGYRVKLIFVKLDLAKAKERCHARGDATGRVVPEQVIEGNHRSAVNNFEVYKSLVDEWEVYDNTDVMKVENF